MNFKEHKEKTDKIWNVLFGNGQKGLIADVIQIKVINKIILTLQLLIFGAIIKMFFLGG